ncbi:beta-mannosidase [Neodiprion lecontei]|uniref:Beta-mannosidase n=1 Tax=Neodiprion lecontei TaxID=441921 RepID=A0A6J0BL11_NEOLC|nr:beta-mannosidase [Neodiprion lecontei]
MCKVSFSNNLKMKLTQVSPFLSLFLFSFGAQSISLNGRWNAYILSPNDTFHRLNEGTVLFDATVPGGVYTDLVKAGIIPENLIGQNDVNNRWVGNQIFAFTTSFNVSVPFHETANAILTFHGLDTFALIFINEIPVGEATNMFVRYRFNVTKHLQVGKNNLKVILGSPIRAANELYDEQSRKYIVPPQCVPKEYNGECHVNHIRKMQASFSWDWGPAFPSIGIWKDVEVEVVKYILVTDVTADLYKKNNTWHILITAFVNTVETRNETVVCNIFADMEVNGGIHVKNSSDATLKMIEQNANVSLVLNILDSDIERWWPNGYGDQRLYPLTIEITVSNEKTRRNLKIGFRTVQLLQEPLTKGLNFYFKINDVPMFAKGSNWIPSSVFPELSAEEGTIRQLLKSAKDAHMNMLRVWGGGFYESDLFYEIADEYGIMIWQDFMFACAMYPTTDDFLDSVRQEVVQNVRRLQHHPSIAIWAGNNENEVALYGNWYGTGTKEIYKQDYIKLYVHVIKTEVERVDPSRPFVVSSPSDGLFTEKNNYLGPDPYSNLYGDVHYYNYINNGWDINQYPRPRFASEYGVESIPSIHTLASATKNIDDLKVNSSFMKHRQHLPGGYESMETLVKKNFELPQSDNATDYLIKYIYLTQINQAVSIKIETEFYRQARSSLNSVGEGMTMGALYWQLNDVWQAPSWSSIEFGGRWKMLHYYAQEFFAPIIVTSHVSPASELELYVVSDKLTEIKNCSLAINTYKWSSAMPVHTQIIREITISSNAATMVANFGLDHYLEQADCGGVTLRKRKCIIELVLMDKDKSAIAPNNYIYPAPLKTVSLPLADIRVHVQQKNGEVANSNGSDYTILLRSNSIALFVWLDLGSEVNGRFSENGFHIFRGVKIVSIHSEETTTAEIIRQSLSVTTLSDIYVNQKIKTPHFLNQRNDEPELIVY